ncbi:hypothetical protein scyTo_0008974 [Scyliorhinus torazame]|uniref:Uncharacterized protein n=1 Tax=Scyliorhinus torazame TaxID=75743 RepID=A0A401PFL5_SCYTO|nr:hypothetical protein [Scyliorhinus torazame]
MSVGWERCFAPRCWVIILERAPRGGAREARARPCLTVGARSSREPELEPLRLGAGRGGESRSNRSAALLKSPKQEIVELSFSKHLSVV